MTKSTILATENYNHQLIRAVKLDDAKAIGSLLKKNPNLLLKDDRGRTVIDYAIRNFDDRVIKILKDYMLLHPSPIKGYYGEYQEQMNKIKVLEGKASHLYEEYILDECIRLNSERLKKDDSSNEGESTEPPKRRKSWSCSLSFRKTCL